MNVYGILAKVVDAMPTSSTLGGIASRYADRCRGDNNSNFHTNGEFRLLQSALPQAQVVLDCGANVGDWTRFALSVNPRLTVHCFEPSPGNFERLRSLESTGRVICNNVGVGSAEGELPMYVFSGSTEYNSVFLRRGLARDLGVSKVESVRLTTIDKYLASARLDHVDFLKIDVEGNELAALQGAREALADGRIDVIQFEYGATYIDAHVLLQDIFDFISAMPYAAYKITARGIQYVPEYSQQLENFAYQNWLLVRREWIGIDRLLTAWSKRMLRPSIA